MFFLDIQNFKYNKVKIPRSKNGTKDYKSYGSEKKTKLVDDGTDADGRIEMRILLFSRNTRIFF